MEIKPVESRSDLRTFIMFPFTFYREDPDWIPPLRNELRRQFDPRTNPLLEHCDYQLFLLLQEGQVIGRIAAFIDHLAVDAWKEKIGLFGYYECIQDQDASGMLFGAAADWLVATTESATAIIGILLEPKK